MKLLVTGAKGFIGKNLIIELKNRNYTEIFEYDIDSGLEALDKYMMECDFVFHLAGVNRPQNTEEFIKGNFDFTATLLEGLKRHNNKSPVLMTSSIQAEVDNPYGRSKKAAEACMFEYVDNIESKVFVYRLPNVFGKWCRPNYNSAVATFCHNIANELPIHVNDPNVVMKLVYIDDVVSSFIDALEGREKKDDNGFCYVETTFNIRLGEIADLIKSFKSSRENLSVPNMADSFTKKLYSTYLSYLPEDSFSYPLKMNIDNRGSFTEFIRSSDRGQFSINVSKPGITKGNHLHQTKVEKFLVVNGTGVIRFRKIDTEEVIEYKVSGDKFEVVDIPPGYTHNIINIGNNDMVTIMWSNECFDPDKPDTYILEV